MGSKDFILELFERLDKLPMDQAVREALQVLEKIRKKGPPEEASKAAKRAIDLLWQNAERMRNSKSLKSAASQLATAYTIALEVLKDKALADKAILQAADLLWQAANERFAWEDVDSGTGLLTIASLMKFLADDFDLSAIDSVKAKINFGRSILGADQLIEIPNLLIQSIDEVNPRKFNSAKQRCLSLLPRIRDATEFMDLINKALMHVEQRLSESIAFPDIKSVFETPKDLILGQNFMANFKLRNIGEGIAKDVTYSISIPKELQVSESTAGSVVEMKPGAEVQKVLELTLPEDETFAGQEFKIDISVSFKDIVGNMRTQTLGPFSLVAGTVSKAEETEKVIKAQKELLDKLKERIAEIAPPNIFLSLVEDVSDLASSIIATSTDFREKEEYAIVPVLGNVLEELISKANEHTLPIVKKIVESVKAKVDELKSIAERIQDIAQTLLNQLELPEEQSQLKQSIQELDELGKSLTETISHVEELTQEKD